MKLRSAAGIVRPVKGREFVIRDPDGNKLVIFKRQQHARREGYCDVVDDERMPPGTL